MAVPTDMDGFNDKIGTTDTYSRLSLGDALLNYLGNHINSIECSDIGQFIDKLVPWLTCSNFKVSQKGLEIMTALVERMKSDFKPYVPTVCPAVVDRLGDSHEIVREKAQALLMVILEKEVLTPQQLFDRVTPAFSHKNSKVREEIMICLVNTINLYGSSSIALSKLTPSLVKLLGDQNIHVREQAFTTLMEIYRRVGDRLRVDIQRRYASSINPSRLAPLMAKMDELRQSGAVVTASDAGEDGQAKIWSRSGMLRSTILQDDCPIYTAAWGPDSNQVVLAQRRTLLIKPLAPNTRPLRWRAHDGLILKVAWNQSNNLIVSGGEDCKYKVWDSFGKQLYSSAPTEYPITCLSWAPGGEIFALGSFNTLKLCDKIGWSHSLDKPDSGNIYALSWSPDGTQLAGACSNGNVIFAHIVDRKIEWKNLEVVLTSRKSITVHDVLTEVIDKLDFPERVAKLALGFNHLVVTTPNQCHIFRISNWNTPFIIDLKEGSVGLIVLCFRHFLLVERSHLNIYSYEGKFLCSPKILGLQCDTIDSSNISLAPETLAVLDQNDDKFIHLLDLSNTRQSVSLAPVQHTLGILIISLNQAQSSQERQLAFIDRNRDIYICCVYGKEYRKISKLGVMIQTLAWDPEVNMLAGLQDATLIVWLFPTALYINKELLRKSSVVKDLSEYGKSLTLISFINNQINMRRLDGALVSCLITPYYQVLHGFVALGKWEEALRLCRFVNEETLWACLACMACHSKNLQAAEESYAAINEFDKVEYIQYIREMPLVSAQNAHFALLCGNKKEAENIFLHNGLIFRAILMHMDSHDWNRALELAVRHRTHVDTVLYERKRYLQMLDKMETNEKFLQYAKEVELDSEKIKEKVRLEYVKEKEKKMNVSV